MSIRDLKALGHQFANEWNKGKTAAMSFTDEIGSDNMVWHDASGIDNDFKGFKKEISDLFDAFPDTHITIDDIVAEGDKVVTRYTYTGTHKGAYRGIPATNKKFTLSIIEIDRVVGGKLVEGWIRFDTLGLMQQLGVIPTPGK